MITSFKTSSSDNKKIFTDAVKRLGALFSKSEQENDDDYNDREYDLLNATYGQSGEKKGILFDLIDDLIDFNFSTTNTSENEQTSAVSDTILSTNLVTEDLPSTLGEISNNKKDNVPVVL